MSLVDYAKRHRDLGMCRSCPKLLAKGSSVYCEDHREKNRSQRRARDKRLDAKLKEECFQHYGKKCHCCEEAIIDFLTLEHVDGNGNNHRKRLFKHNVGGAHMYRWLKKHNYPNGYTILCMNCNWAKRFRGVCPHKIIGGVA